MRKAIFALSVPVLMLVVGCSTTHEAPVPKPHVVISSLHEEINIPSKDTIKSIKMVGDSGNAANMVPKNKQAVLNEVFSMINPESVSVKLPSLSSKYHWSVAASTGPSVLLLYSQSGTLIKMSPAYFLWPDSNGNPSNVYLENIVSYTYGSKRFYIRDPELYEWLKNDKWKDQFTQG